MKHFPLFALIGSLLLSAGGVHAQQDAGSGSVEYLRADTASSLPFSDAVRVGNMLYLSGMIGIDDSMKVVPGGIEAETRRIMENVVKVLERNGSSLDRVIKCTVMLADIKEWPAFNAVYRTYFRKNRYPARSAFGSTGLAFGARAEIEFWATVK
jgi:reactive intermediate/imine deaminase